MLLDKLMLDTIIISYDLSMVYCRFISLFKGDFDLSHITCALCHYVFSFLHYTNLWWARKSNWLTNFICADICIPNKTNLGEYIFFCKHNLGEYIFFPHLFKNCVELHGFPPVNIIVCITIYFLCPWKNIWTNWTTYTPIPFSRKKIILSRDFLFDKYCLIKE